MSDAALRERLKRGTATAVDLARAGLCRVRGWDGNGYGHGHGHGDGYGYGYGHGHGYGYGYGHGHGNGYGYGHGHGDGNGYGDGDGNGYGDGDGYGPKAPKAGGTTVIYTTILPVGSPVVVRSYVSGVIAGRLAHCEDGTVALTDWRWLRSWRGVGGEGSIYDLVRSGKRPERAGPLVAEMTIVQQADVVSVSEDVYTRLAVEGPGA
jgi:hypothetical protein